MLNKNSKLHCTLEVRELSGEYNYCNMNTKYISKSVNSNIDAILLNVKFLTNILVESISDILSICAQQSTY